MRAIWREKTYRAQLCEKLVSTLKLQRVSFCLRDANCAASTTNEGCVVSRLQIQQDGGLAIIGRCEASCLNLRLLIASPIIVGSDEVSVGIVHLEDWVAQRKGDTLLNEVRTDGPEKDGLRCATSYSNTSQLTHYHQQ